MVAQDDLIVELENGSLSYTVFEINDSDCIYSGLGCTDENADNYNENAFISDNSCEYSCKEGEYILALGETIGHLNFFKNKGLLSWTNNEDEVQLFSMSNR